MPRRRHRRERLGGGHEHGVGDAARAHRDSAQLHTLPVNEAVLLYTCNRTELYIVAADPDTAGFGGTVGAGVGGQTGNNGRLYIALKPWDQRKGGTLQEYIARLRPKFAAVSGGKATLQAIPDIRVGARLAKAEYQYTLQDADFDELFAWAPKVLERLQKLPQLRDVSTDQQTGGTTLTLVIDRDKAARFGVQP